MIECPCCKNQIAATLRQCPVCGTAMSDPPAAVSAVARPRSPVKSGPNQSQLMWAVLLGVTLWRGGCFGLGHTGKPETPRDSAGPQTTLHVASPANSPAPRPLNSSP